MAFNNFLRDYFTFNRRERNGVFVLLAIILLLILYLSFSDLFFSGEKTDFSQFENEIASFEAEQKRIRDSIAERRSNFSFSGNTLVEEPDRNSKYDREQVVVEINAADTTELKKIRGIGSVFARRIVKFRDALGGFVSKEQLLEVFGFDREKLEELSSQMALDPSSVKKLNVNTASVEDMNMHPYISKKEAVAVFTRRVKTGDFTDMQEVKKIALMSDSAFAKIAPYLILK